MQNLRNSLAVLLFALFAALAAIVRFVPGQLNSLDKLGVQLVHPLQTIVGLQIFQAFTQFGGTLGVIMIVLVIMFVYRHRPDIVARLLIALVGSAVSLEYLKVLEHRARPEPISGFVIPDTYSFPSGHSSSSIVLYGFLALFLYVHARSWWQKVLAILVPALLILGVALSRLVLGYHYLSDVVGGLLFGGFWLVFVLALPLQHEFHQDNKDLLQ